LIWPFAVTHLTSAASHLLADLPTCSKTNAFARLILASDWGAFVLAGCSRNCGWPRKGDARLETDRACACLQGM
jgi:hypothetical protein